MNRPAFRAVCLCAGGLVLALGVLLAAGCGEDTPRAGVRVRLRTSSRDGPVQGTVRLQRLEGSGGEVFDAHPLPGAGGDVWFSPAAPEGRYRVLTSAGWGMLWPGSPGAPGPLLRGADHPPPPVQMGRPWSVYLAPADAAFGRLGAAWGAAWRPPGAAAGSPFQRVPIEVQDQVEGVVALRFLPEHWRAGASLHVVGRLLAGPMSELVAFSVREDLFPRLPRFLFVRPAAHAPLDVHLVPPAGRDRIPDGTHVEVRALGVPLEVLYEGATREGRAHFDGVAVFGGGLRVTLPAGGPRATFDLGEEAWRLRGGLSVVALDPQGATSVALLVDGAVSEVRALPAGGARFGRLALAGPAGEEALPGSTEVLAPPGPQDWWVSLRDGRWTFVTYDVPAAGGDRRRLRVTAPPVKGCRVRGSVLGGGDTHHVEFVLQLPALEAQEAQPARPARQAAGEGFEAAVSAQGQYEATLPPGTYSIRVLGLGGTGGAPRHQTLRPGMQLRLDLDLR